MASADEEEANQAMQESNSQGEERILVSVRLRPLNDKEASRREAVDWECIDDNTIMYKNHLSPERTLYPNSFTFDRVFRCHCSTRQVYEEGAKAVVLSAVSGINLVFAYGQTSSGKTFTMSGITEYTMEDIFDYIEKHKERDFHLKFSALEIYNESVRDLLTADHTPLRLLDDPERGTVVEKLTEETLRDWDHFNELLAICEAQRQIGETFLNEASSRSHQILRLTIESSTREFIGKNNRGTLAATLNFVDLAGSERASQALSAGSRLKEGSHINRSLLTLGTVIRKLSKGQTGHIPYRDSKLTRILQSSLGGNARTAVICTMSPARSYVEQSRNTLLFASCAKEVTTDARVNVVMSDKALVKHLQRELARLESELRSASPSDKSDATDMLREKDFKIVELETRVKELTLRLDLALSQIHDLQQGFEERRPVDWEEDSPYPNLHVQKASDGSCSNRTTLVDHHSFSAHSLAFETPQSPDRHSSLSYDENYSVSDVDENQLPSSPFEQIFIETPNDASLSMHFQTPVSPVFVDYDPLQVPTGYREETTRVSQADQCTVSDEPGGQNRNSYESDLHHLPEEPGGQDRNSFESDLHHLPEEPGGQHRNSFESDLHHLSEEPGGQNRNSFESDSHHSSEENIEETSDTFEIRLQRDSDGYGSQSPYSVEFDSYQVSNEFGEQTANSYEVDQYHVSEEMEETMSNYDDMGPQQTPEAAKEQTDTTLEEYCKEVQCIESEINQSNLWLPEEKRKPLLLTVCENDKCTDDDPKQVLESVNMDLSPQDCIEASARHQIDDLHEIQELNCVNNNFQTRDMNTTSLSSPEEVKYEIKNENGDEDCSDRHQRSDQKLHTLKNDTDCGAPQILNGDAVLDETQVTDVRVSDDMIDTKRHTYTYPSTKKELTKAKSMDQVQLQNSQVKETLQITNKAIKEKKDVGLNPQDDLDDSTSLSTDVSKLQREIIDLWDACNIPLVHRTSFFHLFVKDDQADTIYMEVERRRLSHIRDAFSSDNSIVLDGCQLTLSSSQRSLQNERKMLSKLMKRRISSQERTDLYARWGISLDSKRRSLQLAQRLWVNTTDMDHVAESAKVVAKLVRFSKPQVPKEVLGLNLMSTQGQRKSFKWTCTNVS